MGIKRRLTAGLIACLAALVPVTVVAAPAQAFTSFQYYKDCPGSGHYQQMKVNNTSASGITIKHWSWVGGDTRYTYAAPYKVTYVPIGYTDRMYYRFTGSGGLNWTYSVTCYY
jgi:hypothetical protein